MGSRRPVRWTSRGSEMRVAIRAICLVLGGMALIVPAAASAAPSPTSFQVLVLTEGNPAGDAQFGALKKAASKAMPKFNLDQAKQSESGIKAARLDHYNAVVFLN